jgi:hypothetical protein
VRITEGPDRRSLLAAAGAALLPDHVLAAGPTAPLLQPAAMRADLALLRRAYETLHPGLLRYNRPDQIAARFDAAADAAARPMSLAGFYLVLSRLTAGVRCGHSFVNPANQKAAIRTALFETPTRLPLEFLWIGDRMVVTADPYGTGIAPGSEVLAIEGRPAGAIVRALIPLTRADGGNDAKRRRLLSVQGGERFETLDLFYPSLFGERSRYRLDVRGPDGRRRRAEVAAISLAERRRARPPAATDGADPIWSVARQGAAAVLTMDDWALYDSKWNWRAWLDGAIDALVADRVPLLVVDLRRNEGGQDCGDALIARLIDRPVARQTMRRLVRYERLPADLRPYCDTWDRSFDALGVGARRYDGRFREQVGEQADPTILPKGPRYHGRVAILTGAQNSSATFQFASAMQRLGLATLVGEETGGNRRGINGGGYYFFRLPETGFEVDLPLIGYFPLQPQPDAGVRPDIAVAPTPASLAGNRDPVLERALTLAA